MPIPLRRFARHVLDAVQATWTVIGVSLLMLLGVELGVRTFGHRTKSAEVRSDGAVDPRRTEPWFAEFDREYRASSGQRWRPYLEFGRNPSFSGRYINVDSAGHRVTPQPLVPAEPVARVYFFGGSTMWGTSQRDDHTIAAEAAHRLQALAGPNARVEVTNFGETGYVNTQELLQLMLELRAGHRPDVVVFYDGLNEVAATVQGGTAGLPQNESKRVAEFTMGRALDRTGFDQGLRFDLRRIALLGGQAIKQLAIADWAQSIKHGPPPTFIPADVAARQTVRTYVENVRLIEALATQYGFTPIYVWQPNLHASEKVLTPFEARLRKSIDANPFHHRLQDVHRILPPLLDSAMTTAVPGDRVVDDATLFHGDTMPVYTDWLGHNTEASVPRIVDTFWPQLERTTRTAIARHRGAKTASSAAIASATPSHRAAN